MEEVEGCEPCPLTCWKREGKMLCVLEPAADSVVMAEFEVGAS